MKRSVAEDHTVSITIHNQKIQEEKKPDPELQARSIRFYSSKQTVTLHSTSAPELDKDSAVGTLLHAQRENETQQRQLVIHKMNQHK